MSVVTVSFNAAPTIGRTLDSVLAQTHPDREILVVDGASTDGTQAVVARYRGAGVRLVSEPDRGMYDALNTALALYTGDAFGALNADDTFHDATALARIAAALEDADMVHGGLDFVADHAGKRVVRRWRAQPRPAAGFRLGWMPAHPTFYARRAVIEAVGAFDLSLKVAADYDFMLRAIELNDFRLATLEGVLVDMQHGGASTASLRAHLAHNLEALAARRRWLGVGRLDPALVAKPARKLSQFVRRGAADPPPGGG